MKIEYTLDLPLFGTPLEGMEDEIAATFLREFSSTVGEVRKLVPRAGYTVKTSAGCIEMDIAGGEQI